MKDKIKRKTGAFRAGIITALILLFASFFFNGLSLITTALLLRIGVLAIYIGILVNVAGAAFAAWVGARLAMIGREMKAGKSVSAAVLAATIFSLLNLASGIAGGVMNSMVGRGGSYMTTIIGAVPVFVVIFFVARAVFRKREAEPPDRVAEITQNG